VMGFGGSVEYNPVANEVVKSLLIGDDDYY
jgi:hypothetical protein